MLSSDYTAMLTGTIALLWTIYQQYKINTMCYECPFRRGSNNVETNKTQS